MTIFPHRLPRCWWHVSIQTNMDEGGVRNRLERLGGTRGQVPPQNAQELREDVLGRGLRRLRRGGGHTAMKTKQTGRGTYLSAVEASLTLHRGHASVDRRLFLAYGFFLPSILFFLGSSSVVNETD